MRKVTRADNEVKLEVLVNVWEEDLHTAVRQLLEEQRLEDYSVRVCEASLLDGCGRLLPMASPASSCKASAKLTEPLDFQVPKHAPRTREEWQQVTKVWPTTFHAPAKPVDLVPTLSPAELEQAAFGLELVAREVPAAAAFLPPRRLD